MNPRSRPKKTASPAIPVVPTRDDGELHADMPAETRAASKRNAYPKPAPQQRPKPTRAAPDRSGPFTRSAPPPRQQHFPGRHRPVKTYGRTSRASRNRLQDNTLTQMSFVSSTSADALDLEESQDEQGPAEPGHPVSDQEGSPLQPARLSKGKAKAQPGRKTQNSEKRRHTLGDADDSDQKMHRSKRRKTTGDSPVTRTSASTSFYTQTLTQLLPSNAKLEEDAMLLDGSETEDDPDSPAKTPTKSRPQPEPMTTRSVDSGPRAPADEVVLQTPSHQRTKIEIPSSQSPATPLLLKYTPGGEQDSPLKKKSTPRTAAAVASSPGRPNASGSAPGPALFAGAERPARDLVVQDSYSTSHSSPSTPTAVRTGLFTSTTPNKEVRFSLPENKENITPGRKNPFSPKPARKPTPHRRQPLREREVPDSDAEEDETDAEVEEGEEAGLNGEFDENNEDAGERTPDGASTPTTEASTALDIYEDGTEALADAEEEEAETVYGNIGAETQAEMMNSITQQSSLHGPASAGDTVSAAAALPRPASSSALRSRASHAPVDLTPPSSPLTMAPPPPPIFVAHQTARQQAVEENEAEAATTSVAPGPSGTQGEGAFDEPASSPPQYHPTQEMESQRLPMDMIHAMGPQTVRSDIMVSLHPEHLAKIVDGTKDHEFRVWKIPEEVLRVWLYTTKPASELKYMCVFGPPKTRGEIPDDSGLGNREFNAGRMVGGGFAHQIMQVYQLNDPVSIRDMIRKGWVKGAPQKYTYLPPAVVGELTANLRCALFTDENEEALDHSETQPEMQVQNSDHSPAHVGEAADEGVAIGSSPGMTVSQQVAAQIHSDVAYSTQHRSEPSGLAVEEVGSDEIIPLSQSPRRPASTTKGKGKGPTAVAEEGAGNGGPAPPRRAFSKASSFVRPSQATTVSQLSSSPAGAAFAAGSGSGSDSLPSLYHQGAAGGGSSSFSSQQRPPAPPTSSPAPSRRLQQQTHHSSLRSSQFPTKSQMLPDSLVDDPTSCEPPPIIWDSADDEDGDDLVG